jgi:hypothetical protein
MYIFKLKSDCHHLPFSLIWQLLFIYLWRKIVRIFFLGIFFVHINLLHYDQLIKFQSKICNLLENIKYVFCSLRTFAYNIKSITVHSEWGGSASTYAAIKSCNCQIAETVFCYQNCSDLLWEKIVVVIEKNFWNSRLMAENLQIIWDY